MWHNTRWRVSHLDLVLVIEPLREDPGAAVRRLNSKRRAGAPHALLAANARRLILRKPTWPLSLKREID